MTVATHLSTFTNTLQGHLPLIASVLTAWIAGRYVRKVRVKVGDVDIEANTAADVERLLTKAQELAQGIGCRVEPAMSAALLVREPS